MTDLSKREICRVTPIARGKLKSQILWKGWAPASVWKKKEQ